VGWPATTLLSKARTPRCGFRAPGVPIFRFLQPLGLVLCEPYGGAGNDPGDLARCCRERCRGRHRRRFRPVDEHGGGFVVRFAEDDDKLVGGVISPRARTSLGIG
jgi:hypothetical protein